MICIGLILFSSACSVKESSLSSGGRQLYEPCTITGYDEDGNKIWEETVNKYGETEKSWAYEDSEKKTDAVLKYEYDSEGRTIREECQEEYNYHYTVYDYDGNTRYGKTYSEDGEMYETSKATLNEKGLPIQIERYDSGGELILMTTFFYDDHGEKPK